MSELLTQEQLEAIAVSHPQGFIALTDYQLLCSTYLDHWKDIYCSEYKGLNIDSFKEMKARHEVEECLELYKFIGGTLSGVIATTMAAIRECFIDKRDPHKITYPLDIIVITILLAKLCGCNTAKEISKFFKLKNLQLQLIVPGMPSVEHGLSPSTINTVIAMLKYEEIDKFFTEYFSAVKITLQELFTYDDEKYKKDRNNVKDTLAFDGQEIRASFRRGIASRRAKGGNVVTLYNCTQRTPIKFMNAQKKNNETACFLKLAARTEIKGSVVMSDALNAASCVTSKIRECGADYLMPIKSYRGNKELLNHVEAIFNREHKNTIKHISTSKNHGRIEESIFEVLNAQKYLDKRIKNPHQDLNTIIKYTKKVDSIINGVVVNQTINVRYYISSLAFNEDTVHQVASSICDYWFIEQAHNLYDSKVFNQDRIEACNENTIDTHVGFNKICHNIMSFIRQKLTEKSGKKTPIPYSIVQDTISTWPIFVTFDYIAHYYATKIND